jgi:hypothetical protein
MKTSVEHLLTRSRIAPLLVFVIGTFWQACSSPGEAAGRGDCRDQERVCKDWGSADYDKASGECLFRAKGGSDCPCYEGEVRLCSKDDSIIRRCVVLTQTSTTWDRACP